MLRLLRFYKICHVLFQILNHVSLPNIRDVYVHHQLERPLLDEINLYIRKMQDDPPPPAGGIDSDRQEEEGDSDDDQDNEIIYTHQ